MDPPLFHYFLLLVSLFLCTLISGCYATLEENGDSESSESHKHNVLWKPTRRFMVQDSEKRPLNIVFKEPARNWTDALPIGNGRLGAMVHGAILSEIINLNGIFSILYFSFYFFT